MLSFNAVDPIGAGGLASDALVVASIGAHALTVATGIYLRDTRDAIGHAVIDDAVVAEQAQWVAEDVPVRTIKVGFVGSAEAVAAIAAFTADYPEVPVIAYMPDLSWWSEDEIDSYLDAFRELLLPQTAVLVGNNTTLRHWLLPESITDRHARTTDLARAAAELGVPYVLATGMPDASDKFSNVLASPQAELLSQSFDRIDAAFLGAGDILSAALAALLATGSELSEAALEALQYLDQALDHGFRPGMGRAVADRLFWAASDDAEVDTDDAPAPIDIPHPFNETKH
ncbi:bifunctional hydroxymethylpyrimidine kinase/phosphomethylpyrimidine kinase [Ottowia sp.]|uniref:bifunctional hydroxymethylpyrimidine kinase/phosphomethylpyrimidine kinase n=1 Tax=Ottowia sp. TaxID=1898956 RepID=UPI002C8FED70|nr:bifunctional hydroxymethylpyrimidine kinase/phosphomethylpyrimidine kinase [Ottowia sp.]HRN74920.1 bifunctional hydroxymethylpyrimidine kinase/phosphomethylpyrimidine kinase [Ottowia sp.]HRQ01793.1 bifunctional hydroxymethylpyrimidine kinase/phosphomethylpyrimidine kinase [Ottowia sp.]